MLRISTEISLFVNIDELWRNYDLAIRSTTSPKYRLFQKSYLGDTWHRGIDLDAKTRLYDAQRHSKRVCIFNIDQDMTC